MSQTIDALHRVAAGGAMPAGAAAVPAARVRTVGSYYAFRRELGRHVPAQSSAGAAAWDADLRPGGRVDAIVDSHFGHPLSSPLVHFFLELDHGQLERIELTWRGYRSARVVWAHRAGPEEVASEG